VICKLFEVRDRQTFIAIIATLMVSETEEERYLTRRLGYIDSDPQVVVSKGMASQYDPYAWSDITMQTAHRYIRENFKSLKSGQVIDAEYIRGERDSPRVSERYDDGY